MAELEEMTDMMTTSTTSVLYCTYDCWLVGLVGYTLTLARVDVSGTKFSIHTHACIKFSTDSLEIFGRPAQAEI